MTKEKKIEQLILDYKIKLLDKGYQAYLENLQKEKDINKKKEKQTKEHYDKLNELLQGFVKKEWTKKRRLEKKRKKRKKAIQHNERFW